MRNSFFQHPEETPRDSDAALHRAKARGCSRYQLFKSSMHTNAANTLEIDSELLSALKPNELVVEFQPIRSLKTNRITGFRRSFDGTTQCADKSCSTSSFRSPRKIDKSFVGRLEVNSRQHQIVKTDASLTKSLELEVTAEGMESKACLERLQVMTHELGQGYSLSCPMSGEMLTAHFARQFETGNGLVRLASGAIF